MYDLLERPEDTLDRICVFLGVSKLVEYPEHRFLFSHKDSVLDSPTREDISYLRELFRDDLNETQELISQEIPEEITL